MSRSPRTSMNSYIVLRISGRSFFRGKIEVVMSGTSYCEKGKVKGDRIVSEGDLLDA